jgi:hypothetical protein
MRSGHLNLRGQGLRPGLLGVLKKEELGIELSISDQRINTTDFTELTTRVNNHLGQSLLFQPSLRLTNRTKSQGENHT